VKPLDQPEYKPISLNSLKKLGWNRRLADELLPPPKMMRNPYYESGAPMRGFSLSAALEAMKDERFINYQPERERRCAAGLRGAQTRARKRKELSNA
jgi:hypothetical protein